MENASYFIEKAAQCRRLANAIVNQNDPAVTAMLALAEEFDARARGTPNTSNIRLVSPQGSNGELAG